MSDPVPLAREVLETAYEDETVTVCSVPDNKVAALARAVIDQLDERGRTPDATEPLPCGCENPFNAIHLLDHRPTERRDQ